MALWIDVSEHLWRNWWALSSLFETIIPSISADKSAEAFADFSADISELSLSMLNSQIEYKPEQFLQEKFFDLMLSWESVEITDLWAN